MRQSNRFIPKTVFQRPTRELISVVVLDAGCLRECIWRERSCRDEVQCCKVRSFAWLWVSSQQHNCFTALNIEDSSFSGYLQASNLPLVSLAERTVTLSFCLGQCGLPDRRGSGLLYLQSLVERLSGYQWVTYSERSESCLKKRGVVWLLMRCYNNFNTSLTDPIRKIAFIFGCQMVQRE